VGTADDAYGAVLLNDSASFPTLFLNNDDGGTEVAHLLIASSPKGACDISGTGDVTCSGRLKTAVPLAGTSEQVEVYSVQSSENWFEDFGSGQLFNGSAKVTIDPKFAGIVNTGVAYHVFLTPKGNCKGLFVTNEGANGLRSANSAMVALPSSSITASSPSAAAMKPSASSTPPRKCTR